MIGPFLHLPSREAITSSAAPDVDGTDTNPVDECPGWATELCIAGLCAFCGDDGQ